MYRNGCSYNKMAKLVIDVYLDYNICGFPVDEHDVCRKIGIKLVPYSKFQYNNREILNKKSKSGFYVPPTRHTPPIIFYNDSIEETESIGNIRRNIFHEVKHYICGDLDENPDDDDLADYFGKYFLHQFHILFAKTSPMQTRLCLISALILQWPRIF